MRTHSLLKPQSHCPDLSSRSSTIWEIVINCDISEHVHDGDAMTRDEPCITVHDRHRSGKACSKLSWRVVVPPRFISHWYGNRSSFLRTCGRRRGIRAAFREESWVFVLRVSYDSTTVWSRLVRTVHDVLLDKWRRLYGTSRCYNDRTTIADVLSTV